jgi:hypothetical protein
LASKFRRSYLYSPTKLLNRWGSAKQAGAMQPVRNPAQVKEQRPLGSECCRAAGDGGHAYTAIVSGVELSHERLDIVRAEGFHSLEGNLCGTLCEVPHTTLDAFSPAAGLVSTELAQEGDFFKGQGLRNRHTLRGICMPELKAS